jgi:hypothetical protein
LAGYQRNNSAEFAAGRTDEIRLSPGVDDGGRPEQLLQLRQADGDRTLVRRVVRSYQCYLESQGLMLRDLVLEYVPVVLEYVGDRRWVHKMPIRQAEDVLGPALQLREHMHGASTRAGAFVD